MPFRKPKISRHVRTNSPCMSFDNIIHTWTWMYFRWTNMFYTFNALCKNGCIYICMYACMYHSSLSSIMNMRSWQTCYTMNMYSWMNFTRDNNTHITHLWSMGIVNVTNGMHMYRLGCMLEFYNVYYMAVWHVRTLSKYITVSEK